MVYEYEANAPTSGTTYVYGINLISSRSSGGFEKFYLYNAHGDVVQIINGNGNLTHTYDYDAFGNEKNPSSTDTNYFRYCGQYLDVETGTYYLRARYYDPATGRFTQQDSWEYLDFADPLSLNLYTYCVNNPIRYVDPRGTSITVATIIVGTVVCGIVGAGFGWLNATANGRDQLWGAASGLITGSTTFLVSVSGAPILLIMLANGTIMAIGELLAELHENDIGNPIYTGRNGDFMPDYSAIAASLASGALSAAISAAAGEVFCADDIPSSTAVDYMSSMFTSVNDMVISGVTGAITTPKIPPNELPLPEPLIPVPIIPAPVIPEPVSSIAPPITPVVKPKSRVKPAYGGRNIECTK